MTKRLLLVVLILFALCASAQAAATWTAQVSTTEGLLNDIYFVTPRDGWTVGDGGTILMTANRGANWSSQASGTANDLNGVHLISTSNGLAVGESRTVCKYDGSTWTASQMSLPANLDLTKVCLVGANTAWVTGGINFSGSVSNFRNLFSTTDGGSTWTSSVVSNTSEASTILNYLYSLYFFDAVNGWLVGINNDTIPEGKVFTTTDNGATWTDISPVNVENVVLRDVYFASTSEGWVSGGNAGTGYGYIYHTVNGGVSWETEFSFSPALFKSIHGSSDSNVWASDRASVFKYESNVWSEDSTPLSTGYFNGIHTEDLSNVWAVGGLLAAEGGPNRYIYKYVVDPADLAIDKTLYISPTTYEVGVAFSGDAIQTNATVTIDVSAGLTITTYEAVYEVTQARYKIDATLRVDPAVAVAGTYNFTLANPDDGTSATGTVTLRRSVQATERPTALPVPRKVFDPATEDTLSILIGTPGQVTASGAKAFGVVSAAAQDVELELIVYRFGNRQIAYRKRFTANPDGYTTVTLDKVTDLGLHISEGVYNAIVIHPKYGKIGSGMIVVHYSR